MTLDKHIEKFGKEFVSVPVKNIRYWAELEMHIGEVIIGDCQHPTNSTIAFEFYDDLPNGNAIAYKPLSHYRKDL